MERVVLTRGESIQRVIAECGNNSGLLCSAASLLRIHKLEQKLKAEKGDNITCR